MHLAAPLCAAPQAKEFGQAEAWMNERMMRHSEKSVAEFITAFDEKSGSVSQQPWKKPKFSSPQDDNVWLVWKYEGDNTLWDMMEEKVGCFYGRSIVLGCPGEAR